MSFKKDLDKWREAEREFAKRIITKNTSSIEFAPHTAFKEWDIKLRFYKDWVVVEKTFEVKDDIISEQTWNVWFEFRCYDKPSWIYESKADYIVYHLWDKFYYQSRGELLTKLNEVEKREVSWWDYNQSRMFIVDKKYLDVLFKKI